MTVSSFTVYSNSVLGITQGKVNLSSDTLVMALLSASYTPAPDTHSTWANVSATEIASGLGYTQGGVVLTGQTDTLTGAVVTFTSNPVQWATATFTAKYAVIVRRAGGALAGTDVLIGFVDLNSGGTTVVGQGGTFSISPSVNGWCQLSHTP